MALALDHPWVLACLPVALLPFWSRFERDLPYSVLDVLPWDPLSDAVRVLTTSCFESWANPKRASPRKPRVSLFVVVVLRYDLDVAWGVAKNRRLDGGM